MGSLLLVPHWKKAFSIPLAIYKKATLPLVVGTQASLPSYGFSQEKYSLLVPYLLGEEDQGQEG